jgi:uncharacterized integral membrane protein (TIGR00698 family)
MTAKKYFSGILFCFIIALVALQISVLPFFPFTSEGSTHPISSEILAIIIGILFSNFFRLSKNFDAGIDFTIKDILAFAIVLLGAKLNLNYIAKSSSTVFLIDIISVILNILIGIWICNKVKLEKNTATLLIMGNAICGSSAIIVLAPLIKASQNQISIALVISSLLGLIGIFIYPVLGTILGLNNETFGIWAGSTIQSVPQVLAAGFAFDNEAGEIATITKLIKVLLLAPTIFLIMFLRKEKNQEIKHWSKYVPPFILGFLVMILLNSLDVFNVNIYNNKLSDLMAILANVLITATMAGIGLKTNLKTCMNVASKPLIAGILCCIIVSTLMIILINLIVN